MHFDMVGMLQTFLTLAAMFCVNTPRYVQYGCLFGIISQPFWYAIAIRSGEIGLLITTTAITLLWLRGIWNFWLKPKEKVV